MLIWNYPGVHFLCLMKGDMLEMESLPAAFWIFYFCFLLLSLITGIIYWVNRKYSIPAVFMIAIALFTPLAGLLFSVQRPADLHEWAFLMQQVRNGNTWAIIIGVCHLYLLFWWGLMVFHGIQYARSNKEKIANLIQRNKAS